MGRLSSDNNTLSPHTAARDVRDGDATVAQRVEARESEVQTAIANHIYQSMRGLDAIADILHKGVSQWLSTSK